MVGVLRVVKYVNLTLDLTLCRLDTAQELSIVVGLGVYELHAIDRVLFLKL